MNAAKSVFLMYMECFFLSLLKHLGHTTQLGSSLILLSAVVDVVVNFLGSPQDTFAKLGCLYNKKEGDFCAKIPDSSSVSFIETKMESRGSDFNCKKYSILTKFEPLSVANNSVGLRTNSALGQTSSAHVAHRSRS